MDVQLIELLYNLIYPDSLYFMIELGKETILVC